MRKCPELVSSRVGAVQHPNVTAPSVPRRSAQEAKPTAALTDSSAPSRKRWNRVCQPLVIGSLLATMSFGRAYPSLGKGFLWQRKME